MSQKNVPSSHKKVLDSFLSCCAASEYEAVFRASEIFSWYKEPFFLGHPIPMIQDHVLYFLPLRYESHQTIPVIHIPTLAEIVV